VKVIFRATDRFLHDVRRDLARPHHFAAERVGFISIRAASTSKSLILLAESYHPVADDDYIDDPTVGAMMGQEAIRKALNIALLQPVGMFHVHMHEHGAARLTAPRTGASNSNSYPTSSRSGARCRTAQSC
jgi:hypothetical protein